MKTIDWEKLQSYSVDNFLQFEEKLEDSIQKELEDRTRKLEDKRNKKKRKKKR